MVEYARGGRINKPAGQDPDRVPALLSPGCCITSMELTARIHGTDYRLGEMTIEVPTRPGKEEPWAWEVEDIVPVLAAALRAAADDLEAEGATDG